MTTIAYSCKSRTMAADTNVSGEMRREFDITKIKKVDGHLVGVCGDADLVNWFHSKFKPELLTGKVTLTLPGNPKCEFEALIVTPRGQIYLMCDKFIAWPVRSPGYAAVGSGASIATGALFCGSSPEMAVKAAIKHDKYTGGRIQTISLAKRRLKK